ncbi:MAG: hypothetical protein HXY25_00095 [Alphaproteobacteria bacterium]|nr:hypothetical protein [Alphaproteobacteria bacterium]
MIVTQVMRGLGAALALLRREPEAIKRFDNSVGGFWSSFWALPIAIPFFAPIHSGQLRLAEEILREAGEALPTGDPLGFWPAVVMALIQWTTMPIVMILVVRMLRLTRRYALYVIAYNWGSLLWTILVSGVMALYTLGIVPLGYFQIVFLMLGLGQVYYQWYIARQALGVSIFNAIAITVLYGSLSIIVGLTLAQFMPGA